MTQAPLTDEGLETGRIRAATERGKIAGRAYALRNHAPYLSMKDKAEGREASLLPENASSTGLLKGNPDERV